MRDFCPGYAEPPFADLVRDYPDESAYPYQDIRVEWGPVFHRSRLDESARILLIGQDPGQHENVLRRILSGEAGLRVQGFMAKLGVTRSYVLINALPYSVYGSNGIPPRMYDNDVWAARKGPTDADTRRNITLTVPKGVIPS
jgi:hypothetical protein